MFNKAKPGADAYTFSLGGIMTLASFAAIPVIADDRINRIRDDRQKRNCDDPGAPAWLAGNGPATEGTAA